MKIFYKVSQTGQSAMGFMDSDSIQTAREELELMGYTILQLTEVRETNPFNLPEETLEWIKGLKGERLDILYKRADHGPFQPGHPAYTLIRDELPRLLEMLMPDPEVAEFEKAIAEGGTDGHDDG